MKKRTFLKVLAVISIATCLSACGKQNTGSKSNGQKENTSQEIVEDNNTESEGDLVKEQDTNNATVEIGQSYKQIMLGSDRAYDTFVDENTEEYKEYAGAEYTGLFVQTEGYENLAKALQKEAADTKQREANYMDEAKLSLSEYGESSFENAWEYTDNVNIMRSDEAVVSFYRENYSFMGGAHPNFQYYGHTYRVSDGAELALSDLVTDYKKCKAMIVDAVSRNEYASEFEEGWQQTVSECLDNSVQDNAIVWCVSPDSLKVIINTYVIGSYALGTVEVEIPMDEIKPLIKPEYLLEGVTRAKKVLESGEYYGEYSFDADGDGEDEVLQIRLEQAAEEYDVDAVVSYGKTEDAALEHSDDYQTECGVDGAYVVQSQNGKYYLYLEELGCNDYQMVRVYDLNSPEDGAVFLDYASGAFYGYEPIDCEHFYLWDRLYMCGTYHGYRECAVGDDGMPVPYNQTYYIAQRNYEAIWDSSMDVPNKKDFNNEYMGLTLKQEITVPGYDNFADSENAKEVTLQTGAKLLPYATDGNTYMTFITEKGMFVDFIYDIDSNQEAVHTFGGIDEMDLLDGIIYAG